MRLSPIGRLRTPFHTIADCPRNGRQPDPPPPCSAEIDPAFQPGLLGLDGFSHLVLLYWLGPQEAAMTLRPPFDGQERGVFATRSPARPNPIGLSVVALLGIEPGRLHLHYLDCLDGTPLLDIKPYLPSTDAQLDATMGWLTPHRTLRP